MTNILESIMNRLEKKFPDRTPYSVKFVIDEVGSIVMDRTGIRIGEQCTDLTFRASAETVRSIHNGETDPVSAYFSGDLRIHGDIGTAIRFARMFA